MKMKKFLILGMLVLAFILPTTAVKAQTNTSCSTVEECQALIQTLQLQAQINVLLRQIDQFKIQELEQRIEDLNRQIHLLLQQLAMLTGNATTTPTVALPFTITSPSQAEEVKEGSNYNINFSIANRPTNPMNWRFAIYLKSADLSETRTILDTDIGDIPEGNPRTYAWTPRNINSNTQDKTHYLELCFYNEIAHEKSCNEVKFQIVSSNTTTNNRPTITSSLVDLSNVIVGQPVSFLWRAQDLDRDNLTWTVNFGDNGPILTGVCPAPSSNTTINPSRTWSQAGTYTINVSVTDCRGGQDTRTLQVTVREPSAVPATMPVVSLVSTFAGVDYADLLGAGDRGIYTITFDVKAVGGDIYIDADAPVNIENPSSATDGAAWAVSNNSSGYLTYSATADINSNSSESGDVTTSSSRVYVVKKDQTRRFTLTASVSPEGSGSTASNSMIGVRLTGLKWDVDSGDSHGQIYNSNLGSFTTNVVRLANKFTPVTPVVTPVPSITSSNPPNGAVDARNVASAGDLAGEWVISLNMSFYSDINSSDFSVRSTNSTPISITGSTVHTTNGPRIIQLNRSLIPGERIRITHDDSKTSTCLGFLPVDVDGNGWALSADISRLSAWVGTAEGAAQTLYKTDINRDGVFNADDVTKAGEILSTAGTVRSLPACPAPLGLAPTSNQSQMADALTSLSALLQKLQATLQNQ